MTYSPKPKNNKPLFIAIIMFAVSAFCFLYAGRFPKYTWLMQLVFVCLATVAIQVLLRYVLTKFEYTCDNKSLYIYKSLGRKKLLVGKLELVNSASYMVSEKEFKSGGEDYKVKSAYTYIQNYKTQDVYVYITTIGETNFMIKIEASPKFSEFVNEMIDKNLKGLKENHEI